jgi:hypothetical protein
VVFCLQRCSVQNRSILRKQYKTDWLRAEDFNNKHKKTRSFIIGGGHSIASLYSSGFSFSLLEKEVTLGVNKAYKILIPTYIVIGDYYFWRHWSAEVKKVPCIKIAPENILRGDRPSDFIVLRRSIDTSQLLPEGLERPFSFVNNTGVAALRIAFLLGCNPIYLVGFDLGPDSSGETHFHNDYKADIKRKTPSARYQQFKSVFMKTIHEIEKRQVHVFSCSEFSPLNEAISYVPLTSLTF